jgi:hypothetical protein
MPLTWPEQRALLHRVSTSANFQVSAQTESVVSNLSIARFGGVLCWVCLDLSRLMWAYIRGRIDTILQ